MKVFKLNYFAYKIEQIRDKIKKKEEDKRIKNLMKQIKSIE